MPVLYGLGDGMKLLDNVKTVNQKTGEIGQSTRAIELNTALIEMHLLGILTDAEQERIGNRLDKKWLAEKAV